MGDELQENWDIYVCLKHYLNLYTKRANKAIESKIVCFN